MTNHNEFLFEIIKKINQELFVKIISQEREKSKIKFT